MGYTSDQCMTHFTEGQAVRLEDALTAFRPTGMKAWAVDNPTPVACPGGYINNFGKVFLNARMDTAHRIRQIKGVSIEECAQSCALTFGCNSISFKVSNSFCWIGTAVTASSYDPSWAHYPRLESGCRSASTKPPSLAPTARPTSAPSPFPSKAPTQAKDACTSHQCWCVSSGGRTCGRFGSALCDPDECWNRDGCPGDGYWCDGETLAPSARPTKQPTHTPSARPTARPTQAPSSKPTTKRSKCFRRDSALLTPADRQDCESCCPSERRGGRII